VLSSVPWAVGGEREGGGGRETEGERQREIYKEDRNTIIVTHTHAFTSTPSNPSTRKKKEESTQHLRLY
jgi:hypothetical protein